MTLLSLFAIVLLPRQFHVTVVENHSEAEIRRAAWLFPLYLVLINLFVVPIALAGLLTFPPGQVDSDMFVLALPLAARIRTAHARRLRRRAFGRDRDGDRRIGRARDHGVERHRRAAGAASGAKRSVAAASDVGWLLLTVRRVAIFVDPGARLYVLPLGRRRAARRRSACCPLPRSRSLRRPSSAG